jgi:hypothetical protein
LRPLARIFDRGARGDTRVPQRDEAVLGGCQQVLFGAGLRVAASAIICAARAESIPSRTARSVAGRLSSCVAVSIAARTSPVATPNVRATALVPKPTCASPSIARFAALAVIPSTTRRITPNSSTTRNAACGDSADASKSRVICSRALRAEASESNISCAR